MEPSRTPDTEPEIDQPGLSELREAVENYASKALPSGGNLRRDGVAGLNIALSSVPDGMASGLLAGVSPIYGLYACMVGPIAGGIFSSTALMVVSTTSAASLTAGQALALVPGEERANALFLMVIILGAFQALLGLFRLGWLTRFVSFSVMTGFIAGIAILTVLSQLPTITGYQPAGGNSVSRTFDLLGHLGQVNYLSLGLSVLAMALAFLLPRTFVGNFAALVAIIVPSLIVAFLSLGTVQIVQDVSEIPSGIPLPALPSLSSFSVDVVTAALAVAAVILMQAAGVSQTVPNPDGSRRSMSRDFVAQGAANIASGFFRGLPVGGSLSTTALGVIAGARTRWASILAGLWVGIVVIIFPGLVSRVAMPALAALLIVASLSTIKPRTIVSLWNTGWPSRLPALATFMATLLLPIQVAVAIGVVLSAVIYLNSASSDITVVELVKQPDGMIREEKPDKQLASNSVTIMDVYGTLFYAGARTLERLLPRPQGANNAAVVLRLRGYNAIGATLLEVLSNYAERLDEVNGRLYISGISERAYDQVVRTGKFRSLEIVRVYQGTPIRGESTEQAVADARRWLAGLGADTEREEQPSEERTPTD